MKAEPISGWRSAWIRRVNFCFFFSLYIFGEPAVHFSYFSPLSLFTEVSLQQSAIPGGNPPGDWQSAVGWGDTGLEPGTVGQQSSVLPLSQRASLLSCHPSLLSRHPSLKVEPTPECGSKGIVGACNLTAFSHSLTGPVGQPFASRHEGPGFNPQGGT
jgi:hypothetical protein